MLIEKEVIRPGTYWYKDEQTGLPRKLVVTPQMCRYWHDEGNRMLSLGLPVPVPYEHDFESHPMTPKEKLLNNAGEVKEYRMKGDHLLSVVDIRDPDVKRKIGHSIRWTSPWINSFTDGSGRDWRNVISHLALTTRPRIVDQVPFSSVAAALSMASEVSTDNLPPRGLCLSRAGRLFTGVRSRRLRPRYPMAFSLIAGGIPFAGDENPFAKRGKGDNASDDDMPPEEKDEGEEGEGDESDLTDPLADANGDIGMEELLCDLLQALGVPMPDETSEAEFKRHLYEATMSKIKELTSKGMGKDENNSNNNGPDQNKPPNQNPHAAQPNPLIKQEQQPMYMSLDEINKLPDPMKGVALAMYAENQKLRAEMEANKKVTDSLRDAKLKEAMAARQSRVNLLSKLSPRVKADLDAMLALPSMALSMGDGGAVVDPMAQTLAVLEKGLADMPRLLTTDTSALSVAPQPTDETMLTDAKADEIADDLARRMGASAEKKAS